MGVIIGVDEDILGRHPDIIQVDPVPAYRIVGVDPEAEKEAVIGFGNRGKVG